MSVDFDIDTLTRTQRIVLCCGSGGVGKTTTAAALGYLAAAHGRRALVLTIDPARRLAQALGLDTIGHAPTRVALSLAGTGELHAMMLDTKGTFDALVEKYAETDVVRQTIFGNSYYQHLSTSLSGSREFMALEKVYELALDGRFDVIIVDTPPSQHALDFIDAPQRLFDLFEGSFVKHLLQPYRVAGRIGFEMFKKSSEAFMGVLEKLSGYQVLTDLSDFFLAFSGLIEGFKERSHTVTKMLAEPTTSFVIVAAPEPASLSAADAFFARLARDGLAVGGFIVNRVHASAGLLDAASYALTPEDLNALQAVATDTHSTTSLAARLLEAYRDHLTLAVLDASAIEATAAARAAIPLRNVPHFNRDLHSLEDIAEFAKQLTAD